MRSYRDCILASVPAKREDWRSPRSQIPDGQNRTGPQINFVGIFVGTEQTRNPDNTLKINRYLPRFDSAPWPSPKPKAKCQTSFKPDLTD